MPKRLYTSTPPDYPVCMHRDCPMAATCLHQISYEELLKCNNYLQLINPLQCTKSNSCTFYRNNKPIVYARGFEKMQKRMFPDQYYQFKNICIKRWSRNPYYERRRGDSPLSPSEQAFVMDVLRKVGITEDLKFDHYEESLNWND